MSVVGASVCVEADVAGLCLVVDDRVAGGRRGRASRRRGRQRPQGAVEACTEQWPFAKQPHKVDVKGLSVPLLAAGLAFPAGLVPPQVTEAFTKAAALGGACDSDGQQINELVTQSVGEYFEYLDELELDRDSPSNGLSENASVCVSSSDIEVEIGEDRLAASNLVQRFGPCELADDAPGVGFLDEFDLAAYSSVARGCGDIALDLWRV